MRKVPDLNLIIIMFLVIYYFLYDPVYPNDGLIKNLII